MYYADPIAMAFSCFGLSISLLIPVFLFLLFRRLGKLESLQSERFTRIEKQLQQVSRQVAGTLPAPVAERNLSPTAETPSKEEAAVTRAPEERVKPLIESAAKPDTPASHPVLVTPIPPSTEQPPPLPSGPTEPTLAAASQSAPKRSVQDYLDEVKGQPKLAEPRNLEPKSTPAKPELPVAPRVPSHFETAFRETMQKIWNWIVVGEEHIPQGVSREFAIASNWLLRIGILTVIIAVGFFLKYSIDRGYLGPVARVALTIVAGLSMLAVGTRLLGRRYHLLGQGLLGGGIASLYFSVYAAYNFFQLLPMAQAFAWMIAITVISGFIAVRFNSVLVAVLGVIGGYGTPLMLASTIPNLPGLFGYMLLLGLGVLAICYYRDWPLVNILSFFLNYGLLSLALSIYEPKDFATVFPFIVGFFVLFSTMTFLYQLVRGRKSNLLDLLALLANAAVFALTARWMIEQSYDPKWFAAVTLSLAAFYSVHVWFFLKKRLVDRELLVSFLGLASLFLAITMPVALSREWVTAAWAVQGVVLVWMSSRLDSRIVRMLGLLLLGIVCLRFFMIDLSREFVLGRTFSAETGESVQAYLLRLAERALLFGVPIGSLGLAARMLKQTSLLEHEAQDEQTTWLEKNDYPLPLLGNWPVLGLLGLALATLFAYLSFEVYRTAGYFYPPGQNMALSLLWLSGCLLVLFAWLKTDSQPLQVVLTCFLAVVGFKLLAVDLPGFGINDRVLYPEPYNLESAAIRTIDFLALAGVLFTGWLLARGTPKREIACNTFGFFAMATLFVYLTLETNSVLHEYLPGFQAGGVSILWAIFALSWLVRGIWMNAAPARWAGLVLFGIVTFKVFFSDLSQLDQVLRSVAFLVLGLLLLAGSFLYLRHRETFATNNDETKESP